MLDFELMATGLCAYSVVFVVLNDLFVSDVATPVPVTNTCILAVVDASHVHPDD
jgi:hypothetical protein